MFCAFLGHTGERLQDHWSSGVVVPPGLCRTGSDPGDISCDTAHIKVTGMSVCRGCNHFKSLRNN